MTSSCCVPSRLFRSGSAAFCVNHTAIRLHSSGASLCVNDQRRRTDELPLQRPCVRGAILSLRRYYHFLFGTTRRCKLFMSTNLCPPICRLCRRVVPALNLCEWIRGRRGARASRSDCVHNLITTEQRYRTKQQ